MQEARRLSTVVRAVFVFMLCLSACGYARAEVYTWANGDASGAWTDPASWEGPAGGYPDSAGDDAVLSMRGIDVWGIDGVVGSLSLNVADGNPELSGAGLTFDNGGAGATFSIRDTSPVWAKASMMLAPITLAGDLAIELAGYDKTFVILGGMVESGGARSVTLHASAEAGNPTLCVPTGSWNFTGGLYLSGGADADHYATFADIAGAYAGTVHLAGHCRYVSDFVGTSATLASAVELAPGCHAVLGRINESDLTHGVTYTGVISGQACEVRICTTSLADPSPSKYAVTLGGDSPNTYTGETVIEATRGGKVVAGKDGAFGESWRITVMASSELYLGGCDAIADSAALRLFTDGSDPARVVLTDGAAEAVASLYFWDDTLGEYIQQVSGTWGSTDSAAQHRTDEWFSGAGVLSVGGSGVLPSADADENGVVDAADYLTLKANMGLSGGAVRADGDFDGDGDVDWCDLSILIDQMGQVGSSPIATPPAAPEPGSLVLLSAASALALGRRRRRAETRQIVKSA